jgi:hypothetical protein
MNIRFIKNTVDGNTTNTGNHWVQIAAWSTERTNQSIFDPDSNVAYGKNVTGSSLAKSEYPYSRITNGNLNSSDFAESNTAGEQYVIVDLGSLFDVEIVQVWHYFVDARIYYQNSLEVSEDGNTWITIQNPTGNMIETNTGNSYSLFFDDFDKQRIAIKSFNNIIESLNNAEDVRKVSQSSVSSVEKLEPSNFQSFYDSLNQFNITWSSLAESENIVGDENIEEIYKNIIKTQNNASCNQGCSYSCADNCSTVCYGGCDLSCGGNCESGCGGNCSTSCGTVCAGGCGNNCSSTCAGNCDGGCVQSCSNTCAGVCTGANGG